MPVKVTPMEYRILLLLMKHPGRVFSADEIYERVWNEKAVNSDTIMVHVRNIREKIEINPKNPKYLKVVWGVGYNDTMRFVVIPQAVKNILPAMGNEFIQLIKETSILGYVGIVDLTKAASYVSSRTYQMFIPLLAAGIVYYLIVKVLSILLGKFERCR